MPLTKVQIISLALIENGKGAINSIGTSEIEVAASLLYDSLLEAELTSGAWRFAVRILPLPLLVDVPPVPIWQYVYQLPADYGKLIRMHPQTYSFEIFKGGLVYSNVNQLSIEYVSTNMDASELPGYFYTFFIMYLAAWLSIGNTQNPQLIPLLFAKATDLRSMGLALDAQNRPSQAIVSAPIVDSRFIGAFDMGAADLWG